MKLITGRRNRVGGRSSIENAGNLHDIPRCKSTGRRGSDIEKGEIRALMGENGA